MNQAIDLDLDLDHLAYKSERAAGRRLALAYGIGAVLRGPEGACVELASSAGYGNSSEAEYRALIAVLEAALEHGADELTVYGDSRVVIDDVNGPDAFAAPALAAYRAAVRALAARIDHCTLRWVPRHKNLEADALSQRATEQSHA